MGDIRIIWDPVSGTGDINMLAAAVELGHDLATASLISMFTDAQADPGDIVFDTDPRGLSRDNQDGNARQSGWESRYGAVVVGRA